MGEGNECDRCGDLHSGSPESTIAIGEGIPRNRQQPFPSDSGHAIREDTTLWHMVKDLCPSCRRSFIAWWQEQGAEADWVGENHA